MPRVCCCCLWLHHAACRIWPGIEPMLPAVEAWSLNHWTARKVPIGYFTLYIHCTAQQHESLRQFSTIKIGLNVYLVNFTLKSHTEEMMTTVGWLLLLLLSRYSHVRLCHPIDSSPPGSPIPGILQARTLEWVAISFSSACKWKVKVKSLSCVRLLATPWTAAHQAPLSMGFSRQEYWSGVPLPSPVGWQWM